MKPFRIMLLIAAVAVIPLLVTDLQAQQARADAPHATYAQATTSARNQWPDWTNTTTKIVPIVAVGTPGIRLGAAQVTGPRDRVGQVDAVLQLDVVFQRVARVRVFIPSTSYTRIDRVQGVAVSALLQYGLFSF